MTATESCIACEHPSSAFGIDRVRFSKRVMPANLALRGGDWCEAFLVHDTIALSIGDVCGHGEEQYGTMAIVRQAIRDAALRGLDPSQVLTEANAFLYAAAPGVHASAFFGLLHIPSRVVTFANAGHPVPIVVSPLGAGLLSRAASNVPLGIDAVCLPAVQIETLLPQSLMVLYTDGVTEHERDPLLGELQLLNAARFAYTYSNAPAAYVIEELMFLTGPNLDDASILTAWIPQSATDRIAVPRRPSRSGRLRRTAVDSSSWHAPLVRPRADDELRITLPGRQRWNGNR